MQKERSVPRIVVTGMGALAANGNDTQTFWENLVAGKTGIDKITRFDTTDITSKVGGELKGFDPTKYMDPKDAKRNDRYVQLAVAAAHMAYADAGLKVGEVDPDRLGVIIGSGIGGIASIEEQSFALFE
ncbi:MAG: beta-ketoacyl-[acyl-carrier-protein] synthase II, partial [Puniceicoccales bacterium]|nr:beta-ketoacyl-[acyl-carrier-protein] synthase II [Puniceicoccales bacterium]